MKNLVLLAVSLLLLSLFAGCGAGSAFENPQLQSGTGPGEQELVITWPSALPTDGVQPWEQLDGNGHVVPTGKGSSAITLGSEFVAGVERHMEGGDVADNGEATHIGSTMGNLSYAIYRLPLGGKESGAVSIDANLTAGQGYFVGLADYGMSRWQMHGPFTDNHVRLNTTDSDFTSSLGNVFICLLANDGAAVDVVGVGVNALDSADTTAPPVPGMPTLTPVAGGLLVEWLPVAAGDLAGYRIYYHNSPMVVPPTKSYGRVDYLEGATQHLLNGLVDTTYVRISAVDFSGNESDPSAESSDVPLVDGAAPVIVSVSAPSCGLGDILSVVATGASLYEFDLDGDGDYDVTGQSSGTADIDTTAAGIIRPRVRGYDGGGVMTLCGGVSVIVAANMRPAASATASPQNGVAPLTIGFTGVAEDAEDEATALSYAWDLNGDGIYEPDTNSLVLGNEYLTPGIYGVKFRVTDSEGAWDVDTVPVMVTPASENMPPVAILRGSQFSGQDSVDVEFSAVDSYDPDGSIADFEWDFDGDGDFNEAGAEEDSRGDANPAAQTYSAGPAVVVRLRVTDNEAATHTVTFTVAVHGWGNPITVDDEQYTGSYSSIAVVSGSPAICYYDYTYHDGDLKYVRATNVAGDAWESDPVLVDSAGDVGLHGSLLVVNGNPAISYQQVTEWDQDFGFPIAGILKFVRALDSDGDSWGTPVVVEGTGYVGQYTSLAIVDGVPAISYLDVTNGNLKFVRASDENGETWQAPLVVDSSASVGEYSCLTIVDGHPAIGYNDRTNDNLKFVRATNPQGTLWASPVAVAPVLSGDLDLSIAIVGGNPAISYHHRNGENLMYVRAADAQGGTWNSPVLVDSAGIAGRWTTLLVLNGVPVIGYARIDNSPVLKYVEALDPLGASWGTPVVVDSPGVGYSANMTQIDGYPAFSYQDYVNNNLKFTRLY